MRKDTIEAVIIYISVNDGRHAYGRDARGSIARRTYDDHARLYGDDLCGRRAAYAAAAPSEARNVAAARRSYRTARASRPGGAARGPRGVGARSRASGTG